MAGLLELVQSLEGLLFDGHLPKTTSPAATGVGGRHKYVLNLGPTAAAAAETATASCITPLLRASVAFGEAGDSIRADIGAQVKIPAARILSAVLVILDTCNNNIDGRGHSHVDPLPATNPLPAADSQKGIGLTAVDGLPPHADGTAIRERLLPHSSPVLSSTQRGPSCRRTGLESEAAMLTVLTLAVPVVRLLRNCCAGCPSNQLQFVAGAGTRAEAEDKVGNGSRGGRCWEGGPSLLSLAVTVAAAARRYCQSAALARLDHTGMTGDTGAMDSDTVTRATRWKLIKAVAQFCGNTMVANPDAQQRGWSVAISNSSHC
jgi:hypothetical protein